MVLDAHKASLAEPARQEVRQQQQQQG
jgi:hypothetical protein